MERKIGEEFTYENHILKVVPEGPIPCKGCCFDNPGKCVKQGIIFGPCQDIVRKDNTSVIFKDLGEYNSMKNSAKDANIHITLDEAKKWYQKGGDLKKVALRAFSECELADNRSHSWKEFCTKHPVMREKEAYIDVNSSIQPYYDATRSERGENMDKNIYPSKEYAKAALALCQLLQLRQEWISNWRPDWKDRNVKYVIVVNETIIQVSSNSTISRSMSFPTEEMAEEFIADFKDLLEQAKILL